MTYKEEGSKAAKGKRSSSVSTTLSVRASTKHGLRKKCSNRMTTTPDEDEAPVQFVFTSEGVVRRDYRPPSDCASPSPKGVDLITPDISNDKTSLPFSPGVAFTEEERKRVQQLVGLDQTILISFNDLEEEVAVKVVTGHLFGDVHDQDPLSTQVLNEMYEKAVSFETMDYQLVFWGYTFAIKKLTWFAQVGEPTISCNQCDCVPPLGDQRVLHLRRGGQEGVAAAELGPHVQHQVRLLLPQVDQDRPITDAVLFALN